MSTSVSKGPPNPSGINRHFRAIVAVTRSESPASDEKMPKSLQANVVKYIKGREDWRDQEEFVFDYAYGPWITSEAIYSDLIRPILPILLSGVNCSVLASGATGSGISNILLDAVDQTGLINATMSDLFGYMDRVKGEFEFQLAISYFEVSDDGGQVRDLMNSPGAELQVRETRGGGVNICNLSWHRPRGIDHLMEILGAGENRRSNDDIGTSSRLHAIFQLQIQLHQRVALGDSLNVPSRSAKLVMVDLVQAGNDNVGEGVHSDSTGRNGGLLALGRCLTAIAIGSQAIPFRDSTLTMTLKDVFKGDCKTVLISKAGTATTPKEWFPIEIWATILSNLDDLSDTLNLSRTCKDLHHIVRKILDPIRMVYRHIIPYLCKRDILSCRQVSRGIWNGVDKFLANHPYREFQNEEWMDYNLWQAERVSHGSMTGNFKLERNPFVGRTLYFADAAGWDNENGMGILRSRLVQEHIFHVVVDSRGNECCSDCGWKTILRFVQRIPNYCNNIKSIRVAGRACFIIEEERTYKRAHEDFIESHGYRWDPYYREYRVPDPISIDFEAQHTDGHCVGYNAFKRMIFNELHGRLVKFELFVGLPDMLMPSYKCHHLSTLKLVGGSYDKLVELVERLEAPLLQELILAGTYPYTYAEVTHFQDWINGEVGEFLPTINIGRLGKALTRFPMLGVLKLVSISKKSNWIGLEGGDRPFVGRNCREIRNKNSKGNAPVGERDQTDEEMQMWWQLTPNVMEVQVDWIYYLMCNAGNDDVYYLRRRTICEDCPPKTLSSNLFRRGQASSMY